MKATRFYFSNGQNTVSAIANTLEQATRAIAEGYTFNGQTAPMEYTHAGFAKKLLAEIGGWKTRPIIKDWVDTGFILTSENEDNPEFSATFHAGKVAFQYRVPMDGNGRTLYDPDPLPTIRISVNKPMKQILSELNSRLWAKAVIRHKENMERVRESRRSKEAQETLLKTVRQLFGKEGTSQNPVQMGGAKKGWFGNAWVMDSGNVRINIDSIDSTRALKILKFISELK